MVTYRRKQWSTLPRAHTPRRRAHRHGRQRHNRKAAACRLQGATVCREERSRQSTSFKGGMPREEPGLTKIQIPGQGANRGAAGAGSTTLCREPRKQTGRVPLAWPSPSSSKPVLPRATRLSAVIQPFCLLPEGLQLFLSTPNKDKTHRALWSFLTLFPTAP